MSDFIKDYKQIEAKASKAIDIVNKGISWIQANNNTSSSSKVSLLKKEIRTIDRVRFSASRRPSIAIFGQSQVGKSFLVRTLAKSPKTSKLEVQDIQSNEPIDFLQRINPPGGRESTGIITRFSTALPVLKNPNFNFKVELLSQLDVAAIVVNAYLGNIKEFINSFDRDAVAEMMIKYKSTINQKEIGVSSSEVYDFNAYIIQKYKDNVIVKEAQGINFFNDLIEVLPKMPYNERWKPLSYLWGGNEFLTNLFQELSETLNTLDFEKVAYINKDAIVNDPNLISKEYSDSSNILDVARVKEIFKEKQLPDVTVAISENLTVDISRGKICALIKELHLTLPPDFEEENMQSFLNFTDLLDFPGSKNEETTPEEIFNQNRDEEKLSSYVRGKVSYLFYLYNRDMGISTLLYCMHQEPPEVPESPRLLNDYIKQNIGDTPEARNNHESEVLHLLKNYGVKSEVKNVSPLLVVMTKFNSELTGKGDAEIIGQSKTHDAKWFARFQENFCTYMQKPIQDKWVDNWAGESNSFKFVFPVRDPGFSTSTFEGYKETGAETTLRQTEKPMIEDMRKSFYNSEIVDKFIFAKDELWKNLLSPNQTGMDYLCKYLAPSSHPANMIAQLNSLLDSAVQISLKVLSTEHQSGDMDSDLKNAKKRGANAYMVLMKLSNSKSNSLSSFLNSMIISESEIWKLIYEYKVNFNTDQNEKDEISDDLSEFKNILETAGISTSPPLDIQKIKSELQDFYEVGEDDLNEILFNQLGINIDTLISNNNGPKSSAELFTDNVLSYWMDKLSYVYSNSDNLSNLSPANKEAIVSVIEEFMNTTSIRKVKELVMGIVSEQFGKGLAEDQINTLSGCITSILNRYIFSASWLFEEEKNKPIIKNTDKRIFEIPGEIKNKSIITTELLSSAQNSYISDFTIGVKELYAANIKSKYNLSDEFNTIANQRIGEIIFELAHLK